ncbi:dTDP-4-dehydrorhamnose 3,5-epimerase [Aneurinibacillus sp. Ricciae_BoGa-3]|uniref:dTDP-4-dehydrorhamnose 3,5-epimerase n=1 Tax=Aneurinibacillus sp. Ricciae_BoGa-3 TaxID=3022697 RepID=UPI002340493F|nr:dTDP-4-dehydrorhamnose 3,5-epimerase [Aneurinibacillus sp. Ricciae_BoGa-3]WCK56167.1 dTDP-4-dehydrorhamnose 3,5-epimerase [Aneurinibacillus sp. Ricciae_BoGa-3]
MKINETKLDGVLVIEPDVFCDRRGFFMESYNESAFNELGLHVRFLQDNHSLSINCGTIRGLHYQLNPKTQTKLVRVLTGVIYDVVVDIRKNSPTFGQYISVILSEENKRELLIPKGYAHGFCTLAPNTQVAYKVDEYYSPDHDRGILWSDPDIGIEWPTSNPVLSKKDEHHPLLKDADLII